MVQNNVQRNQSRRVGAQLIIILVMLSPEYLQTMCRYNRWMNQKLYAVCATIPDEIRKADKGAFFRSMHGTLNHLLLTDRSWLARFVGEPVQYDSLAEELYSDFAELRAEREKTDTDIKQWVQALTAESLAGDLKFTTMSTGVTKLKPLWLCVIHFFNHQTHHRGQLTTLMEQSGYDSGVTDLAAMPLNSNRQGEI